MIIEIVSAALFDEKGLGPLYRIEQLRDGIPWVHLIARSAVATDMELFGIDSAATIVEWHIHEALAPLTTEPSPADQLAFEAQQLTAAVLAARVQLATGTSDTRLADHSSTTQDAANDMRDRARDMKTGEIDRLRETITVADDDGFANLCTLVSSDQIAIDTDRLTYRNRITNPLQS